MTPLLSLLAAHPDLAEQVRAHEKLSARVDHSHDDAERTRAELREIERAIGWRVLHAVRDALERAKRAPALRPEPVGGGATCDLWDAPRACPFAEGAPSLPAERRNGR